MVFLYDSDYKLLEAINEVSFSYSKKAGKEGGGKVILQKAPHNNSLYIIIYTIDTKTDKQEYITSGYITELSEAKEGYSLQFKTFENLLKNYSLPKKWKAYNNLPIQDVVADLMFGFRSIYKTSKGDLGVLNSNNPTYLYSENITFNAIEEADLTLAFDEEKTQNNNYYYCKNGFVIFQYDLGEPCYIYCDYKNDSHFYYPLRLLRWSEQVGEKTFVKWKAIEKDFKIDKDEVDAVIRELAYSPVLQARRDEKKDSIEAGVKLPNRKRFLILQLILEYVQHDYVNDFNIQEINIKASGKKEIVKRTVRGFTPIIHGFEILNRCPLAPFSLGFKDELSRFIPAKLELAKIGKDNILVDDKKITFDGAKVLDVLTKMQEIYKFNLAYDFRENSSYYQEYDKPIFHISMFFDNAVGKSRFYGRDLRRKEEAFLKSADEELPFYANFSLSRMKKKLELPILIECNGGGRRGTSEMDSLRFVFYINYVLEGKAYKRDVFVYGADSFNVKDFGALEAKPVNSEWIDKVKGLPYTQEVLDVKDAIKPQDIANEVLNYLIEKENKGKAETFEAVVIQDIRLHDYVRILHAKSGKIYDVFIKEEKINSKNDKVTKTVGLSGEIYNPFDSFFAKNNKLPIITKPTIPIDVKVTSHQNRLRIEWTPQGVYDTFVIRIERMDGVLQEGWEHQGDGNIRYGDAQKGYKIERVSCSQRFFPTTNKFMELTTLSVNVIYRISISSYYEEEKSDFSLPIYFKMEYSNSHIRHLSSLEEEGEEGDEVYFYDNEIERTGIGSIGDLITAETGYHFRVFNCIEEVTLEPCTQDWLDSWQAGKVCFDKKYSPYCDTWDELFYERILYCFGKYYVWKGGEWRERRFILPSMPIVFFDLQQQAFQRLEDVLENKDFRNRWSQFIDFVKRYQKIREKLNRMRAYYFFKTEEKDRDPHIDEITPFSTNRPKPEVPPPEVSPPKEPKPIKPPPTLKPITWTKGKGKYYYDGVIDASEADLKLFNQLKERLGILKEKIDNILRQTYSDKGDSSKIIYTFNENNKPPLIYDASGMKNHLEYRLEGGKCLQDVSVSLIKTWDSVSNKTIKTRRKYFLKNAFKFIYEDLDNGGDKNFNSYIQTERFPFYQKKVIPFLSERIDTKLSELKSGNTILKKETQGEREFTFSSWVAIHSASDNVFLWDISGLCLGYVKDEKLHIGHKSIIRKKDKDTKKVVFEYPINDFVAYDYSKEQSLHDTPFIHVMVLCKVKKVFVEVDHCLDVPPPAPPSPRPPYDNVPPVAEDPLDPPPSPPRPPYDNVPPIAEDPLDPPPSPPRPPYDNVPPIALSPFQVDMPPADVLPFATSASSITPFATKSSEERRGCAYFITQEIYINFRKVGVDEYEKYNGAQTIEHYFWCEWTGEEKEKEKYHLENFPALRIAHFNPKPHMPYKFVVQERIEDLPCYYINSSCDETDYSWTHYDFDLAHFMLFAKRLSKLERYYLREYGIYPIERFPNRNEQTMPYFHEIGHYLGGSALNNSGAKKQYYLGIVNVPVEKKSKKIKTLRGGDRIIEAGNKDFFLMAVDCPDFIAGALYRWEENEWVELTPYINYLKEVKIAFNDIKDLPQVAQNYFYKKFATFGLAICNGLFSSTLLVDSLSVVGDVAMINLPEGDPHKKGALFMNSDGFLCISKG